MYKPVPSAATRRRYREARIKLGYAETHNCIDWSRISKTTTFSWKFETLQENVTWVWESSCADFVQFPNKERGDIVLDYVHQAFGISHMDLIDDLRDGCIFIPRVVAIVCLRRSGVGLYDTARAMDRDHTTITNAMKRAKEIGLFDHVKDISDSGLAFDGEQVGDIPPQLHQGPSETHRAPRE